MAILHDPINKAAVALLITFVTPVVFLCGMRNLMIFFLGNNIHDSSSAMLFFIAITCESYPPELPMVSQVFQP